MTGLITKGIGGFYYVLTEEGIIEAKGRGIFKKDGITLAVGDIVELERTEESKGVINAIHPRKNQFIRPPIVNVDTFIVVFAPAHPKPNYILIDKFLIMAEMNGIEPVLCLNKCDLVSEEEVDAIRKIYEGIYPLLTISCQTGQGLSQLEEMVAGKKAALAGPSGVGKSTILNSLHPEANMETGAVSQKTRRGKHTTRHVEIFQLEGGGMIYDTPGFTSFEILEAEEENLASFYPEMDQLRGQCRYDDCRHVSEPECAVRDAVKAGTIHKKRYDSYLANLEEIRNRKKY
ncbi:MAG: ribosome small subunit-dependent GTPase A [Firmicutes bacterium]|nr:ribosome small subunit-dependent GTPase A [Bacillota bacterium]